MLIKSIEFKKHPVLWNLKLDFTNENGNIAETVIIAWENGTGKSTILESIFHLWSYGSMWLQENEERIFEVEINEDELQIFHENAFWIDGEWRVVIFLVFGYNKVEDTITCNVLNERWDGWTDGYLMFSLPEIQKIFYAVYSSVWINYNSRPKTNVTSEGLDRDINQPLKTSEDLADKITQLLIDIQAQDDSEIAGYIQKYLHENPEWDFPRDQIEQNIAIQMQRFKNAFDYMFENKKFKEIRTTSQWKEVIFEENWKECTINQLSSWEKQIVFRGSFLLQNKNTLKWKVVLIDEPEISLHPNWQLKITDFYKKLFTDDDWFQTNQIFIVTHSPFVIHNPWRINDKVITLSKNNWDIVVDENPKFFGYSNAEEFVTNSFDVKVLREKPVLLVEDKYFQIYKIAYLKTCELCSEEITGSNFDELFEKYANFSIHTWEGARWVAWFLRQKDEFLNKNIVIGLFDFDKEGRENFYLLSDEKFWKEDVGGKKGEKIYGSKELWLYKKRQDKANFYAMLLPIPERLDSVANVSWSNFISYVEIENLLPENFLLDNNLVDEKNEPCWRVLKIKKDVKESLWKKLFEIEKEDFKDFKPIFETIEKIINEN